MFRKHLFADRFGFTPDEVDSMPEKVVDAFKVIEDKISDVRLQKSKEADLKSQQAGRR
jgi:hypothetical protein